MTENQLVKSITYAVQTPYHDINIAINVAMDVVIDNNRALFDEYVEQGPIAQKIHGIEDIDMLLMHTLHDFTPPIPSK